ncbi:hypothetical protein HDV06_001704 [Boothiomyces sp. JEL0866]|nr:hypothetical protein HDV06_001704 [Boothiomyces sp. JEL0866]
MFRKEYNPSWLHELENGEYKYLMKNHTKVTDDELGTLVQTELFHRSDHNQFKIKDEAKKLSKAQKESLVKRHLHLVKQFVLFEKDEEFDLIFSELNWEGEEEKLDIMKLEIKDKLQYELQPNEIVKNMKLEDFDDLIKFYSPVFATVEWRRELVKLEIADGGVFCLLVDGEVACRIRLAKIDEGVYLVSGADTSTEHKRKGYATKTLMAALNTLPAGDLVFLQVVSDNTPAIKLYERTGFKTIVSVTEYRVIKIFSAFNLVRKDFQIMKYFHSSISVTDSKVKITDCLYGDFEITDSVIVELLSCPALKRLDSVLQYGVPSLIDKCPPVTRLEHSVGAMLLVRKLGGSLEEQVSALLHDVSHTAFSHVIDHAFPGKSYHEEHKMEYINTTNIRDILVKNGMDETVLEESRFPLLEKDKPDICADRLDYGLRDILVFDILGMEDVQEIVSSLFAYPSPSDPSRRIVFKNYESAFKFANGFIRVDDEAYAGATNIGLYETAGKAIKLSFDGGYITTNDLYKPDKEFFELLKAIPGKEIKELTSILHSAVEFQESNDYIVEYTCKPKTVDPEFFDGKLSRVGLVNTEFDLKRRDYINSRNTPKRINLMK